MQIYSFLLQLYSTRTIVQTISFGHRPKHWSLNNGTLDFPFVLSCALFWWTKIEFVRNLVPEIATTQKGLANLFPFEYMFPNSPYDELLIHYIPLLN